MADAGGFGQAIDGLKDAAKSLAKGLGFSFDDPDAPSWPESTPDGIFDTGLFSNDSDYWSVNGADWGKVFSYQFVIVEDPNGGNVDAFYYTLPIPPQQVMFKQVSASMATPTIGGVVEETSPNTFWTIQLVGTTGIAVTRGDKSAEFQRTKISRQFRQSLSTTGLLAGLSAGINSVLGKVGTVADSVVGAVGALQDGDAASAIGDVVGAANAALLPPIPYGGSGVDGENNGYTEAQELSKFLYMYSRVKAANPTDFGLRFKSFKDGQQWDCIVQDFTLQKSAQNPMLYRYQIVLKAWSVTGIQATKSDSFDRFGPGGDLKAVNTVGIQAFNLMKGVVNNFSGNSTSNSALFLK